MSNSRNTIRFDDATTTPVKLKYTASYGIEEALLYGVKYLSGVNVPITPYYTGSEAYTYRSIKHLYYSNTISASYQPSSSYYDNWMQSTAASGTVDAYIRNFPISASAEIKVISIPREVFGEQISRSSFSLVSATYYIIDDGNGNLVDTNASRVHVGNILYAQGMVIVTNPDYQDIFGGYLLQENYDYILQQSNYKIKL